MTFLEQVDGDLNIFLADFGRTHLIDGVSVTCVLDSDGAAQAVGVAEGAVFMSTKSLYAKTADLAALAQGAPKVGRVLDIDGLDYMVVDVDEAEGMTQVRLSLSSS